MEININCDLGESSKLHSTENDPLLLEIVNSANIACGYHAGDTPTMEKTVKISKKNNVSIGAHPSFKDLENFGRKRINLPSNEIRKLIKYCDLDWDPACLEHHKSKKTPIKTVSISQARKPVYKSSVNSNSNYEIYLSEMFNLL